MVKSKNGKTKMQVKGNENVSIKFTTNDQLNKEAIEPVANATSFVWTGTADIKPESRPNCYEQ